MDNINFTDSNTDCMDEMTQTEALFEHKTPLVSMVIHVSCYISCILLSNFVEVRCRRVCMNSSACYASLTKHVGEKYTLSNLVLYWLSQKGFGFVLAQCDT